MTVHNCFERENNEKKKTLKRENGTCSDRNGHRFRKRSAKILKMVPIKFLFFLVKKQIVQNIINQKQINK